jgi:hypothetical protein
LVAIQFREKKGHDEVFNANTIIRNLNSQGCTLAKKEMLKGE